jgi:hypothetical protein
MGTPITGGGCAAGKSEWERPVRVMADEIDYSNFKSRIASADPERAHALPAYVKCCTTSDARRAKPGRHPRAPASGRAGQPDAANHAARKVTSCELRISPNSCAPFR